MTEEVKISVVVPVYNNAQCLPRCIDSLLAQTYKNLEIIVVNDGSTDNTEDILAQYRALDPRVRPIQQENGGVTSARIHGICEATGDWIGFVDGDDQVEPIMYEQLLKNALAYDADISHCGYQMVFDDGRIHYFYNTGDIIEQDTITSLCELLSGARIEPGLCNKLFHKSLFDSLMHNHPMPADIKINEDLLMNFILFSAAKNTVFEDFCPYHYIVRKGSASRQKLNWHKIYDPIRVKEVILNLAPAEMEKAAQAAYLSTCINVYNSLVLDKQPEYKQERKKIRQDVVKNYKWTAQLSRKQQLLACMIRYMPWIYSPLYTFYAEYVLKNPYE